MGININFILNPNTVINVTVANEPQASHTVDANYQFPLPHKCWMGCKSNEYKRTVDPEFVLKPFFKFIEM